MFTKPFLNSTAGLPLSRSLGPLSLLVALGLSLGACELFIDEDPADGTPFALATDQGSLQLLSGGTVSASLLWDAEIAAAGKASIASDGNSLFVGSGTEVNAFSQSSGAALWTAPIDVAGDVVALAGPGQGAVYAMTLDGTLAALAVNDGSLLWSVDLLVGLPGSSDDALLFAAGALLLGGDPIRSLDPADGSVRASYASGDSYVSDMAVVGSTLFAGLADGVVALSVSSLSEQWRHDTADEVDNLAVGSASVFYSVVGQGVGLLTTTGNPVAEAGGDAVFEALAVSSENLLLGARSDGTLFAWDEAALADVWSVPDLSTPVQGLVSNSNSVFYAHGLFVDGINLSDGSSLWIYTSPGNPVGLLGL